MTDKPIKVLILDGMRGSGKSFYNAIMLERLKQLFIQDQIDAKIIDDELADIDIEAWKKRGGKMLTVDSCANLPVESPSVGKPKKTAQWLNKPYGRKR